MIRIPIRTPSRSYQVLLDSGLLAHAGEHLGKLVGRRACFVITVPPVRRRWGRFFSSLSRRPHTGTSTGDG